MQLREDVTNLKEVVENIATILNKKLIEELYKEAENVQKGKYYTEEEFMEKHKLKTL